MKAYWMMSIVLYVFPIYFHLILIYNQVLLWYFNFKLLLYFDSLPFFDQTVYKNCCFVIFWIFVISFAPPFDQLRPVSSCIVFFQNKWSKDYSDDVATYAHASTSTSAFHLCTACDVCVCVCVCRWVVGWLVVCKWPLTLKRAHVHWDLRACVPMFQQGISGSACVSPCLS